MSGDALGYLAAGAALLYALPTVLTVGACAATAYGVYKLVQTASRHSVSAARTFEAGSKTRTKLAAADEEHNRRLQAELDRQARELNELLRSQTSRLDAASRRLSKYQEAGATKAMEAAVKEIRHLQEQITQDLRAGREQIYKQSMERMTALLAEQEQAQRKALELVAQKPQDNGAKAYATTLINAAIDAYERLIDMMSAHSDPLLSRQASQLRSQLVRAQEMLGNGAFQLACIDATQVASVSQRLAYQAEARRMDLESRRQWMMANIEAVAAELEKGRCIAARDENGTCIQEDLDDFVHGRIEALSQQLVRLQNEAAAAGLADMGRLQHDLDAITEDVQKALAQGRKHLRAFYMRMSLMEKIKSWAIGNLYKLAWVGNEQDDASQPLAAHFVHQITGNEFTFVLGEETADQQMKSSLSLYFADGHEMNEAEKASMRASMADYLSGEGIQSAMSCSGAVNGESAKPELRTLEAFRGRVKAGS